VGDIINDVISQVNVVVVKEGHDPVEKLLGLEKAEAGETKAEAPKEEKKEVAKEHKAEAPKEHKAEAPKEHKPVEHKAEAKEHKPAAENK
jgi:hypothetical protein